VLGCLCFASAPTALNHAGLALPRSTQRHAHMRCSRLRRRNSREPPACKQVSGTAGPTHAPRAAQGGAVAAEPARGNRRWVIVGLCFVAFMLCNMDRVNMSIAILPMSKQFGWDSATIGLVQSSFFWCAAPPSRPPRPLRCVPCEHAKRFGQSWCM